MHICDRRRLPQITWQGCRVERHINNLNITSRFRYYIDINTCTQNTRRYHSNHGDDDVLAHPSMCCPYYTFVLSYLMSLHSSYVLHFSDCAGTRANGTNQRVRSQDDVSSLLCFSRCVRLSLALRTQTSNRMSRCQVSIEWHEICLEVLTDRYGKLFEKRLCHRESASQAYKDPKTLMCEVKPPLLSNGKLASECRVQMNPRHLKG